MNSTEIWQRPDIVLHTQRLLRSYKKWTSRELLSQKQTELETSRALFDAPFVVVSDGLEKDPIFNYGNKTALNLFVLSFADFTRLPSKKSAEPVHQSDRERLRGEVDKNGFISDYKGIRIASTGKRFWIENAIVWIVVDEDDQRIGKAATFATWTPV